MLRFSLTAKIHNLDMGVPEVSGPNKKKQQKNTFEIKFIDILMEFLLLHQLTLIVPTAVKKLDAASALQ